MSLRKIAERVGTSVATVSVVLNGKEGNVRISEATRRAILDAAREVGYTPNIAARRLRVGGSQRITVALVWALDSRFPLIARVLRGVQQFFDGRSDLQHEVVIETFRPGHLRELDSLLSAVRFHGAVIGNTAPEDDAYLEATPLPAPVVRFQRRSRQHCFVNHDGFQAGQAVADYLNGLGHRHVGILYPEVSSEAVQVRFQGFIERAGQHALRWSEARGQFTEAGGAAAARELLAQPGRPTALFALSDTMAAGALFTARRLGLRVPADLSVVGYDDTDASQFTDPPLTTVRVPIEAMAAEAVRLLVGHLQRQTSLPREAWFETQVVVRESCAPPTGGGGAP